MKKIAVCVLCLFFVVLLMGCSMRNWIQNKVYSPPEETAYKIQMKQDILCLMMAYPEVIKEIKKEDNKIYIVLNSGNRILYDDRREKSSSDTINNPDLQDMMAQLYPIEYSGSLMEEGFDPGRIRIYPLLTAVYGKNRSEIEGNLVNTKAGYRYLPFNKNNRASEALKEAMEEVVVLTQKREAIYSFVFPVNGTYNYRYISGTGRLSPHAFGIAIDVASHKWDYWQWATREQGQKRLNGYPREVVEIFEKHNFIWGGKWGHFDILHFEYRPELILKAQYFSKPLSIGQPWYGTIPEDNLQVKEYIISIDTALEE